jgi:hypothetical protein
MALMLACFSGLARADLGEKPQEATRVKPGDKQDLNPFLKDSIEDTVKKSLKVTGERAGYIVVNVQNRVYTPGTYVLFFRKTEVGLDMMARGEVQGVEGEEALIKLDLDEILKVPAENDLAVPLASPSFAKNDKEEESLDATGFALPDPPGDPGYIQATYGFFFGNLDTKVTPGSTAFDALVPNDAKKVSGYRFRQMQFAWYPEFIWHWGFEWEKYGGIFPTFTYYHTQVQTDQDFSRITVNYRFRRMWGGHFRPTLKFQYLVDIFQTSDPDEHVITSHYTSLGLGLRLAWEFTSPAWTTRRWFPFIALHEVHLEGSFYPIASPEDVSHNGIFISRGTKGSGNAVEWRAGATGLMYFYWMPVIKRWVITADVGQLTYNLSFSGATRGEVGNPFTIYPGTRSTESYMYWTFMVGIRLDDFVGKFLKPNN